ncbi:hypothetical protein pb186bvf_010713 [Paramecium bursaria]
MNNYSNYIGLFQILLKQRSLFYNINMNTKFNGNQLSNNANMKPDQLQRLNNSITPVTHQHIGQKDENQKQLFSHINSQNQQNHQNPAYNRDSQNTFFLIEEQTFQLFIDPHSYYGQQDYGNKIGSSNTTGIIPPSHTHKDQNRTGNYFGAQNQVSAPYGKNLPSVPDLFANRQTQQQESQKPVSLWDSTRQDQKNTFTNRTSSMYDKNQIQWNQKPQIPENKDRPAQGQQNLIFGNNQKQVKPNQDNPQQQNQMPWNQVQQDQQKNQATLQEISDQNKATIQQGVSDWGNQQQYNVFQNQLNQPPNYNQPNQAFNNNSNFFQQPHQQNTQDQQQWPQQNNMTEQFQNNALFNNNQGINQYHNQHQQQITNTDNQQPIQDNSQQQRQIGKKSGKQDNSKQSKAHLEGIVNKHEPPMIFKIDIDLPIQTSGFENIPMGPKEFVLQNIDVLKGYYQTQKDKMLLMDEMEQARIINEQRMRQEREFRYKQSSYNPFEQQKDNDRFNHNNYDQRKFKIKKAKQTEQEEDRLKIKNDYIIGEKPFSNNSSFYRPVRQEQYIVDISIMVLESNQQHKLLNFNISANIRALEIKQQIIKILGQQNLFVTAKFDEYSQTSQLLSSEGQIYAENDRLNKYSIRSGLLLEIFINPEDVNRVKNLKITPPLSELKSYSIDDLLRIDNVEVQLEDGCKIKWIDYVDFTYVDLDEVIIGSQLYDIQKLGILRIPKFGYKLNSRRLVQQQVPFKVREDFKSEQSQFKNALEAWAIRETQLLDGV